MTNTERLYRRERETQILLYVEHRKFKRRDMVGALDKGGIWCLSIKYLLFLWFLNKLGIVYYPQNFG